MREPAHGLLHWRRIEAAGDRATRLDARDEPRIRQHVEMLHDGGKGHRERAGKFAYRKIFLLTETGEKCPPRRVGKGGEGTIERHVTMINHLVMC